MRAVVQRVLEARVTVNQRLVGAIRRGLLVLVGIASGDTEAEADWLLEKVVNLRIFENDSGKFDRSLQDLGGELLMISQFTLLADTRRGRRPSFTGAARPEHAEPLYQLLLRRARERGISVAGGEFGARMQVQLVNDGPVTIVLDSKAD